jgi:hypothetical protein
MKWYGYDLDRRGLEAYSSDLRQFADIRLITLDDGAERGVRAAEVRTGSGFDFTVLLDRGLDIGTATYRGVPLAWHSGTGAAHPSRYEPGGMGWLRTFHGGLLALCGMTQAGWADPAVDDETGEILGLHGRVNTLPAYDVRIERTPGEAAWSLRLHGTVDEVVLFGHKLRLERTFEFTAGEAAVHITDRVRNFGGQPAPLMMLYHCNLGFPIVSPDSRILSPAAVAGLPITPRDAAAEPGRDTWMNMDEPTAGYAEQVFFHTVPQGVPLVTASITNPKLGLGVAFDFDPATLTHLTEWKQMGFGDYTVGIEPANCLPEGRTKARANGRLRTLAPGETETFRLTIRIEDAARSGA